MPESYHKQIDQLFCDGDFRAALACIEEAIAHSPTDPVLHLKRADCRISCDENADIRDDVQRALNLDPNSSDAYSYLAYYWHTQFDLKQCRDACEKALKLDPENYSALFFRGNCSSWSNGHLSAVSDYKRVLELTKDFHVPRSKLLDIYYYRTASYTGLFWWDESHEATTEAIRIFPNQHSFYIQRALNLLEDSTSQISQKDLQSAESDLRTAESLLKKNEIRSSEFHYAWTLLLCERQENEKALKEIDTALEIQPRFPNYHSLRGRLLLYFLQKPQEALESFNSVVRLAPEYYGGYLNRLPLLKAQANSTVFQADLKQVMRLLPTQEMDLLEIAQVLNDLQGSAKAREICEKIIKKNPENAQAYFQRGLTWFSQGIYDMAYQDFDEAIRKSETEDPLWFSYRGNTANALAAKLFLGKRYYFRKALKDYSKACELAPKTPELLAGRGYSWYNIARRNWFDKSGYRKALDDLAEAIRLKPDHSDHYLLRAEIYWQLKEFDQVIEDCTQVIQLAPENLAAHSLRMNAHRKKQDFDASAADMLRIHEIENALLQQREEQKSFNEKYENKNRIYPF